MFFLSKELGSVSLDGQAYMKVILWLEEDLEKSHGDPS